MTLSRQFLRKSILAGTFLLFQRRLFHLFFSPVLVVVAASHGVANGSLLIYVALFLASLFFGRAWCGWLCPGAAMNEACSLAVRRPCKAGGGERIKYVVFALWAGFIVIVAVRAGGFHSVDPFFGMGRGSLLQGISLALGAATIVVACSLHFGKFGNCRYLCWQAPILILGTKIKEKAPWPSLHLKVDREACRGCRKCDHHCPMSLPVSAMAKSGRLYNPECILCGNCVDHCPTGAIQYAFSVPDRMGPSNLSRAKQM